MPEVVTPPCRRAAAIPANGITLFVGWAARTVAGSYVRGRYGSWAVRPGARQQAGLCVAYAGRPGHRLREQRVPRVAGLVQLYDRERYLPGRRRDPYSGGPPPRSGPSRSMSYVTPGSSPMPPAGDMSCSCLTFVTLGVFSPARLAEAVPRMADCRSCSVERRCCAPPVGRTGSESHSTRRLNCRKAALGRTYGNLSGSVSGVQARRPVGVHAPGPAVAFGRAASLVRRGIR